MKSSICLFRTPVPSPSSLHPPGSSIVILFDSLPMKLCSQKRSLIHSRGAAPHSPLFFLLWVYLFRIRVSLYSTAWPETHGDPSASAPEVLQLHATMPRSCSGFIIWVTHDSSPGTCEHLLHALELSVFLLQLAPTSGHFVAANLRHT